MTVLIDYENVQKSARRRFLSYAADRGTSGHVHPRQVGELIASKRRRPSVLHEVRVYRGQPNPWKQTVSAAANERQASDWRADGVTVIRRNLWYPDEWPNTPPTEKGIDVAVAVDAVRLAAFRETDVIVIFSHDNDLLPAVETVMDLQGCHIEVAAWSECNRLRLDNTQRPWCHYLGESDFNSVRDHTDYTES
ncbi:NYN domain-containing protein [Allobranchiibius huperziae]|uniref:Uncharacterized LabA/DUF88 family protein n=1 Tax=Allobranchiibius huperziae TaxID=1874116 RepID=A0A853DGA5_9MICO|nr:uncharacterized LabA/DUF88 family protein [Allobranchiibius huperziae]